MFSNLTLNSCSTLLVKRVAMRLRQSHSTAAKPPVDPALNRSETIQDFMRLIEPQTCADGENSWQTAVVKWHVHTTITPTVRRRFLPLTVQFHGQSVTLTRAEDRR